MPRDPRVDPKVGDIVKPNGNSPSVCYHPVTVQARLGNLVAFTEDPRPNKVVWLLLSSWCEVFGPIDEWTVLHVAEDPQTATDGPPSHAGAPASKEPAK